MGLKAMSLFLASLYSSPSGRWKQGPLSVEAQQEVMLLIP